MVRFSIFLGMLASTSVFAADTLTPGELCSRLEIAGEVYVYDQAGEKLLNKMSNDQFFRSGYGLGGESNQKNKDELCKIKSSWGSDSSVFTGPLFIYHEWIVSPDGKMKAVVKQYAEKNKKMGRGEEGFSKLLKEETYQIKDMSPITWPSVSHKNERVVLRFTPSLVSDNSPKDLKQIPFSGEDLVVVDNAGNLWAKNLGAKGVYVGFKSLHGSLFLSYYPFKGSSVIGAASESKIELRLPEQKLVFIYSKTPFLPDGINAKVYGIYFPQYKATSLNSQSVSTSDEEKNFLQSMEHLKNGN